MWTTRPNRTVGGPSVATEPNLLQIAPTAPVVAGHAPVLSAERDRLVRRARLLAWTGNAWHLIEFAIAVAAGVAAGSIALVGFGIDSMIESLAGFIIPW